MGMWFWMGITVVLLAVVSVLLWRTVRLDGLGHRPPPVSRRPWADNAGQPT